MNGNRKIEDAQHRAWMEVDLAGLRRNYARVAKAVRPASVLCVVKAGAYGLGAEAFARTLAKCGAAAFGVATPEEAMEVKSLGLGLPVQILSAVMPEEIAPMVEAGVTLPVADLAAAKRISAAARKLKTKARVHFKLDTGMGRLGILAADAPRVIRAAWRLPNLDCEGIFSHCPVASDPADPFTKEQFARFRNVLADVARDGIKFRVVHVAASDAINFFPQAARRPFNRVRAGLDLHGCVNDAGIRALGLEQIFTFKARIAQVRRLPTGTTIGYGRTFRVAKPARIATLAAGYADGIPLALSNRGRVLVRGVPCPVVGRISMDYTTVDVSHVPGRVDMGDAVTLLGRDGGEAIPAAEWGDLKGTHPHDILTSISPRVVRIAR